MAENYILAAARHWADGMHLERDERNNRTANADQLFGFAAECALKVALLQLPNSVDNDRLIARYREHIDVLWDRIPIQGVQRRFPTLAAVLTSLGHPFDDWSIHQRYEDGTAVTEAILARHRNAAKRLLGVIGVTGVRQGS